MKFFIKDNYYFDIDLQNQLRISGPENHLFLGLTFPPEVTITIENYSLHRGSLRIEVALDALALKVPIPVVTDIRTLRTYTEQINPRPTYAELLQKDISELVPKTTKIRQRTGQLLLEFSNFFIDENGVQKKYGSIIKCKDGTDLKTDGKTLTMSATETPIRLVINTVTNIRIKERLRKKIFSSSYLLPRDLFSPEILTIYDQAQEQVEHLIRAKKTSSFEYGTIFPRDWIESADLGLGDLSQETVDYMYGQSMAHISDQGEAWHEDVIGEFKTKLKNTAEHIDRKMIDIEPRYILGMKQVSKAFLTNQKVQEKLRLVAKYLLRNAEDQEQISFKKIAQDSEEYHHVGNWRDSYRAYPAQKSPLSPYDVNCVFYPMSLRVIREFYQFFEIESLEKLNALIDKWSAQKDKFRLYHSSNLIGYSLALHGKKHVPLPIAHLDESYDLFYGSPNLEEIVSFADKIMDPNFFYTPVGPLLVDIDDDNFTTGDYHGKVIWPKQAAYSVAGLAKQFRRGLKEGWPWPMIEKIKAAVITTSEACFTGWEQLGAVPELYYFDESSSRSRFYTDQSSYEGQMSLVQLWSSVGCRRIMQDYASVKKIAEAI
jgi:hypothetical protein